jgi:serine kinase of HPr protein (carbohydrate metabolism regulator)
MLSVISVPQKTNNTFKTMFTINNPKSPVSDCQKNIQPLIQINNDGKYYIPKDLMLQHLPQEVIDSFLDFINQQPPELHSKLLELIKSGVLTIVCK